MPSRHTPAQIVTKKRGKKRKKNVKIAKKAKKVAERWEDICPPK